MNDYETCGWKVPRGVIPPVPFRQGRFDGDDPYVVCAHCGARRDAFTGLSVDVGT